MKRLFSLLLLLFCSLTLCGAAAQGETWLLEDYTSNDTLPKITIDNAGHVWVAWLANDTGDNDVYCQHFTSGSWSATEQVSNDAVDQHRCALTYDPFADIVYAAWDSSGYVLLAGNNGSWSLPGKVNPSGPVLAGMYPDYADFAIDCSDSGYLHVAWSSETYQGCNGALRTFKGNYWDSVQICLQTGALYSDVFYVKGIASVGVARPRTASLHDWSSVSGDGSEIIMGFYDDSLFYWSGIILDGWNRRASTVVGIRNLSENRTMVCYQDSSIAGPIKSSIISDSTQMIDTVTTIMQNVPFHSGSLTKHFRPTVAWSDSHTIFLNTYYDTMWSQPPVRISDEALVNCINPDIVAENDSTVWVCYQNDGDIYVTRTSVPLGVSEKPIIQIPNPQSKIGLKSWPNPANNVIHFSYTLPTKRNSSVSIYDIAGRLVKTIEVRDNQIYWNCADNVGRKVASGVYFARLRSGGQETIQRISIIK